MNNQGNLQDIWNELNSQWKSEGTEAFYRYYILKMSECIGEFDNECDKLSSLIIEFLAQINDY